MGVARAQLIGAAMTGEHGKHCESIDLPCFQQVLSAGGTAILNDERAARITGDTEFVAWVDVRITCLDREHLLYTWRDSTDRHVAQQHLVDSEQRLRSVAGTDELTGLANRRTLHERLPAILEAGAESGGSAAVIFCDLDDFKAVNDGFGHDAGDEVLRTVAERFRTAVRSNDLVVRFAGDEILAIIGGVSDIDAALQIAGKLRTALNLPIRFGELTLRTTASFGVCLAEPGDTVSAVLMRADAAMYSAKRAGRDRISVA